MGWYLTHYHHSQIVSLGVSQLLKFHIPLDHGPHADSQILDLASAGLDECPESRVIRVGKVSAVGDVVER
jgi:hypothetical protein